MQKEDDLANVTKELHQLFVWLSKKCLTERPRDVQQFCLEKLASRLGMRVIETPPGLSREVSLLQKDNIEEFVKDIRMARPASKPLSVCQDKSRKCGYASSDEDHRVEEATKSEELFNCEKSVTYVVDDVESEDFVDDDDDDDDDDDGRGRRNQSNGSETSSRSGSSKRVEFFNCDTFSEDELERLVEKYVEDERMIQLFRAWDGDNSGAIDFVELVIALHKFENVASAGVDIKVAADALVEFVESDTERELKLPQFAKVIVVFARNLFGKSFDDVADHMLKVATSTSEAAMLQAEKGKDVSDIVALDREELELMRETAQCVSVNVENNISKLRTTRTFRGGSSAKSPHQGAS